MKYKDWEFKDVSSCDAPEVSISEDEKNKNRKDFEDILKTIKTKLDKNVKDVQITNKLNSSPSCIVQDSSDQNAQMIQMMRAMGQDLPQSAPILQINPEHEIIKKLKDCKDDQTLEDISWIL